jgi:hypothetical protein
MSMALRAYLKFQHKDSMPGRPLLPPPIVGEEKGGGKGAKAGSNSHPGKRSSGHFLMSEFQRAYRAPMPRVLSSGAISPATLPYSWYTRGALFL